MTVTTDRVDVSYSGYRLVDDNIPTIPSPQQLRDCSGLVCPLDAGAAILTGTDTGFITVGVSLLDSEPEFALDGWEESVDVSIHAPQGQLAVDGFNDTPSLPELSTAGPGWYRVRCLASGVHGGTPAPGESSRVFRAERVSANRWHNEASLKTPRVDVELLTWIREGYAITA